MYDCGFRQQDKMRSVAEYRARYFKGEPRPWKIMDDIIRARLRPGMTVVDAGCGRTGPQIPSTDAGVRLIGVDLVKPPPGALFICADLANTALKTASVDLVLSRSVMEHLRDPLSVYREIQRVMKPGGSFVMLTPNFWDYVSLAATVIPNRMHARIVHWLEGRAEEDTFPTFYRSNTLGAIHRLASQSGFDVVDISFLGMPPPFNHNAVLFLAGTAYEKIVAKRVPFLRGWILAELRRK
jgi:SAM-dependent methyltransferase